MDDDGLAFPATPRPRGPPCRLPSPGSSPDAMAEEEPPPGTERRPEEAAGAAAAAAALEDRMDLLWEDFNEDLAATRRAGGGSCSDGGWVPEPWSSDAESEPAAGRALGCAPVLRPSSRAGAAGHYRRRAGSWVLLMRIFRRLFVVDKTTIAAAARRRQLSSSARL